VFYALLNVMGRTESVNKNSLFRVGIFVYLASGFALSLIAILGVNWWGSDPFILLFGEKVKNFSMQIDRNTPLLNLGLQGAEGGINPNAFAGTLCLFVPLAVTMFIYFKSRTNRRGATFFLAFCLAVMVVLIFVSMSIGSWIALFVSVWFVFMARKWTKASFYVFVLIAVLLVVFNLRIFPEFNQAAQDKYEIRIALWSEGVEAVSEKPWFGAGLNQFRMRPGVKYELSHAHNHLIHTAAELGIPGLVAYLSILLGAGYMCIRVWKKGKDGFMRMAVLGLGAGHLAHFLFGMGDSIPLGAKTGVLFWISLALIAGIYNYTLRYHY
jgi:putative inorganic carbon (HCO3(-)) transporter